MSKADVGHSALDTSASIVEVLAAQHDSDAQLRFLRAAVEHARVQLVAADDQIDQVTTKYDDLRCWWEDKIAEAHTIRAAAASELDAFTRELEALVGE